MGDATFVADLTPDKRHEASPEVAPDGLAIWERIRRRVDAHLATIEVYGHRLLERDLTADEASEASSVSATLARHLGLLELTSSSRLARHLASIFAEDDNEAVTAVHVAATCEDIRALVASAVAQHQATASPRGTALVMGDGTDHLDAVAWVLASRGFGIVTALDAIDPDEAPSAAVVAVEGSPTAAGLASIRAIAESWMTPIIVLNDSREGPDLRRLARHAAALVPIDATPTVVAEELLRSVVSVELKPMVMLCGSTAEVASRFRAHGFTVGEVGSPDELLSQRIPRSSVIVFGRTVPASLAADLARVLQASAPTRTTPLVWDHGDTPRSHTLGVAREGVLTVDDLDDSAISWIAAQLRVAEFGHAEDMAEAGVALTWPAAQVLLDRSLVAAHRSNTSVAVASITVGESITDEALPDLVEAFAREFRRGDIVSLRSDRNLVVALQGVSRRVAVNRMSELFERFSMDDGSGRAGVAAFPNDGRSAAELVVAADAAASLAGDHGGPRVAATTWRPESAQSADIMIVDPDPVLSAVLSTAFEERGLRVDASDDGRDAFHRLTGDGERSLPSLLLIDLDTPGMGGMALIRRLGQEGVLGQTSVLLMTARTTEADIRVALDLGVRDIIRKPFSTTLLVHRAARLLEDRR